MDDKSWIEKEKEFQQKFNDIKIQYQPCTTLSITILRGRNIHVNFLHDLVGDIPDPQVYLTCDSATGRKKFRTKVARDQANPVWNETFVFVLADNVTSASVKIEAYEVDDFKFDPLIGSASLDASDIEMDKSKPMTLDFGEHGQIDIVILKQRKESPDFRLSLGLCQEERACRIERKPKTMQALRKFLGDENAPKTLEETPTIGLAMSGGGYRAMIASCGVMEALSESGLLDTLMYMAGLSGSSWYMSSSLAHQSLGSHQLKTEHHDWLRKQVEPSPIGFFFDINFYKKYRRYRNFKSSHNQKTTFVDFFGMMVGEVLLGEEYMGTRLSDMKKYVEATEVPFPLIACAHVRNNLPMSHFWEEVEMTPYEISIPSYGMNLASETFDSTWYNGVLQQTLPEPPLHYIMGTCGSAFAILWSKVGRKSEMADHLWEHVESMRPITEEMDENGTDLSSDDDDDDNSDVRDEAYKNFALEEGTHWLEELEKKAQEIQKLKTETKTEPEQTYGVMNRRDFLVERTARVNNCAFGQKNLTKYRINTQPLDEEGSSAAKRFKVSISKKKHNIALCDPGIGCNLPTIHVLRPQRAVDILIVVSYEMHVQENTLGIEVFATMQKQAREHGIKTPCIDLEAIANDPFRELYIFEDEDDLDCPLLLWFTLANGEFKKQENPHRRQGYQQTDDADLGKENFTDFDVFSETSAFGTMNFSYSALNFDRLRELMRFNIMNNIGVIKEKITSRVQKMRDRKNKL